MDEVTIEGVKYERVSVLAKRFKYTTDYIGQLCRAKKVDAQLVGRSWYVNPLSLESHKKSRYVKSTTSNQSEKTIKIKTNKETSRISVQSVITKNAAKTPPKKIGNFAKRINWKPVKYEYDKAALLPAVGEVKETTVLNVDLADSTDISINNTTETTKLIADELPTVALKGKLKVSSLEEVFSEDEEKKQVDFDEKIEKPEKKGVIEQKKYTEKKKTFKDRLNLASKIQKKPSLTPKSVLGTQKNTPSKASMSSSKAFYFFLMLVAIVLLICLIALLTISSEQTSDILFYESTWSFSFKDLLSLFSNFFQ